MIVPFPPGGLADLVARPVAESMSRDLGQPVVGNDGTDRVHAGATIARHRRQEAETEAVVVEELLTGGGELGRLRLELAPAHALRHRRIVPRSLLTMLTISNLSLRPGGETANAMSSKGIVRKGLWVRLPPRALAHRTHVR